MRQLVIFGLSLVTVVGAAVAIFATQQDRDYQLRGYVHAVSTDKLPYRLPRLGVNADLSQYDETELRQHFAWMEEAHIHWVRQFAYWDNIQPNPDEFQWDTWDRIIQIAADYDIEIVVVLMNSPEWARDTRLTDSAPPDDPADFTDFVAIFAQRYGDSVHYYQIWDEPNLDDAWGGMPPKPHDYTALLQAGYQAIKGNDSNATVLSAALAPTTEQSGDNISDIRYLEDLYALGANIYWDAVAGKPYGFDSAPYDREVDDAILNFSRLVALREIMVVHGEEDKALWASAWGWNSLPDGWQGDESIWGQVSRSAQVFNTLDGLTRARDEWPWLGGMILADWQPNVAPNSARWGFAIIDQNNQPTPLWEALTTYDFDAIAKNGLYHPINRFTTYSGVWTFGDLGADIGWLESSDSQFAFTFSGQDAGLLLREGDYFAFLYPQIDGDVANAIPTDNLGNGYVFLRSASREPEINLIPIAMGLTESSHTMTVTADKGWDQWALAGMVVSDRDARLPYTQQLQFAWVTFILSVITAVVTGIQLYQHGWRWHISLPFGIIAHYTFSIITSLALLVSLFIAFNDHTPNILRRDASQYTLAIIITGGLVALTLPAIIVILSTLILFVLVYNRLVIGIHLVMLYAPFVLFPVELYQFAFPMAEYMLLLTVTAGILKWLANQKQAMTIKKTQTDFASFPQLWIVLNRMDYLVILWIVVGVLAWSWSMNRGVATTELRTVFIEPTLLYILIRLIVRTPDLFQRTIMFFIIGAFSAMLISLGQYVTGANVIIAEEGARRLGGVYGSPNNMALYLSRALPFLVAYLLVMGRQRSRLVYISLLMSVLLTGGTILLTQSIGAILLGVPLSLIIILSFLYGKRMIIIGSGLFVLGGAGIVSLSQVSARFANLIDLGSGTTFLRLRVWESAINIIRDYPITGLGLDQFLYVYRSTYIRPDAIWDAELAHPHNILLDHWIRLGIIGVALFFAVQWTLWHMMVIIWKRVRYDEHQWLILGMMGSFAGILAHGLVDNAFFYQDLMIVVMMKLAIITNWHEKLIRSIDAN